MPNIGGKIALDLIGKFPNTSSRALARMAYKECPGAFTSEKSAHSRIRYYRGSNGVLDRKKTGLKNMTPIKKIPQGMTRMSDWKPIEITGPCKALVIGDSHIPYHDAGCLKTAIEYGKLKNVNLIILNGDTLDCHAVSKWETDPRERNFKNELDMCRDFLEHIRGTFKKADIFFKLGNHEERFERYMWNKAPEMLGIEEFQLDNLLGLPGFGISLIADKRPIRLGDLNVIHGHEYRFAISNPVNPARGLFLKAKEYAMCNHFHQSSYHTEKNISEGMIATWSLGCMCDLHPNYMPMNNWAHGFAIVEVDGKGKFQVEQKTIRHGKLY